MELKYVGAKPIVSQYGVSFDQKEQDPYTLLNSVIELLEALSLTDENNHSVDLCNLAIKEYNEREIVVMLEKYCDNLEEVFEKREAKTEEMITNYINGVKENKKLSQVEREAWLGNIRLMKDYYLQFVTNEHTYRCALGALVEIIRKRHIREVVFALGRNYALVLGDMRPILVDHKMSLEAQMTFDEVDGVSIGKLTIEGRG